MRNTHTDDMKHLIRVAESLLEIGFLSVLYYVVWRFFYYIEGNTLFPTYFGFGKYVLCGVYMVLLGVAFGLCDGFRYGHYKFTEVMISQWTGLFVTDVITYFQLCLIANVMIPVAPMFIAFLASLPLTGIFCYIYSRLYHAINVPHNMLMIYGNENALDLKFKMDARQDRYRITELLPADTPFEQLKQSIARHDAVIIADLPGAARNDLLKHCYATSTRAYIIPKISDLILDGAEDVTLFDTPLKLVKGRGLTLQQRFVKRLLDLFFSLIAVILLSPVMLLIALAIKLDGPGPVFFRQKRVTRGGREFSILKFRSMVPDAESGGYKLDMRARSHDPRVTRIGRFIRATRLDELPQLFNIIRGDMSIIGPRPERVEHVRAYAEEMPEWHFREKVRGGLTGFAQVFGRYETSPIDKLKLDIMYIEHYSLLMDVRLALMTVRILLHPDGAGFDHSEELARKRSDLLRELNVSAEGDNHEQDDQSRRT